MLDALQAKHVDAVLIDTFSMASYKSTLADKQQKVKALVDSSSGYGFVLAGISRVLKPPILSMIEARQKVISEFISSMKENIPVSIYKRFEIIFLRAVL